MILPGVNVMVDAFLADSDHHEVCRPWLETTIAEDRLLLPDTVLAGSLRIATNRRIQPRPAPIAEEFAFVTAISADAQGLDHPRAVWRTFGRLVDQDSQILGGLSLMHALLQWRSVTRPSSSAGTVASRGTRAALVRSGAAPV